MKELEVRVRSWVRGSDAEIQTGLLGYLSIHYGDLLLDGIVLRRTADGRYALSWPARTDRGGRRHPYIRPETDDVRREIERELLGQISEREDFVA